MRRDGSIRRSATLGQGALALLSAWLAIPAAAHEPGYRFADVVVESVYDGDTLTVTLPAVHPLWGDRAAVRIAGIDTPEIRGECIPESEKAIAARDALYALVSVARRVDLEQCGIEKFGRLLCRVLADRRDAGEYLISEGHARPYTGGKRQGWCP